MIVSLRQQLLDKQQRVMLRVTGTANEVASSCEQYISQLVAVWPELQVLRFGRESSSTSLHQQNDKRIKKFRSLLGQECDLLVFDIYAGLNPDALAALTGTIKVGGICLLLSPSDENWSGFSDPEQNKLCVAPYQANELTRWYEERFIAILNSSSSCINANEDNLNYHLNALVSAKAPVTSNFTLGAINSEQQVAVAGILEVLAGDNDVALVVSDRGRGKSTSLGLAIAEYFSNTRLSKRLALVSPYSDSVQTVFQHLAQRLTQKGVAFTQSKNEINTEVHQLRFLPPDQIEAQCDDIDAFFVDEAAAVPVFLLEPILNATKPLVLATTVSGYEGTGRGFEYKLKPKIKKCYGDYRQFELSAPIRWHQSDALEPLVNELLALNVNIQSLPKGFDNVESSSLRKIEKQELITNPGLLTNVFALLVNAHYQTKPNDLRTLLDAPNMAVWVTETRDIVLSAILVAEEGPIDTELLEPIWRGERRPRGHLFPQSLICHSGYQIAGHYRFARIVRIAVHPALQNNGIGSNALTSLAMIYEELGFDFLCTSFGGAPKLIEFWRRSGFSPVRMGLRKEKATGEVSTLMALGLTQESAKLLSKWTNRFEQVLDCEIKLGLRRGFDLWHSTPTESALSIEAQDQQDLRCYINHHRPLDTVWLALWRLLNNCGSLDLPILKQIMDNPSELNQIIDAFTMSGEKELNQRLKQELKTLALSGLVTGI